MEQYTTIQAQSIWDLSNLLYGNTSNMVKLVKDNPQLGNIGKTIPAGTVVFYEKQKGNQIVDFYQNRSVEPGTRDQTEPLQGSGFDSGFKINGFNEYDMATLKNRNDLLSEAANNLPDNTTQEISPQDVREMSENLAESSYNRVSDAPIVGLKVYNEGFVYENGQGCTFDGSIYIANKTTTPGTFNPADWDEFSGGGSTVTVSANDTTAGYLEDKVDSSGVDGVGVIRTIENEGANEKIQFRLGDHYLSLASTSLYTGAVLSVGANTGTFDLTVGEGFYVDSNTDFNDTKSTVKPVTIAARTNEAVSNIATQPVTYILIDKDDNIIQLGAFPTPQQRRDNIFIGVVVHSDNINVNVVNNLQVTGNDGVAQICDIMEALGFFKLSGNAITANGANLSLDKTTGTAFKRGANYVNNKKDPHTITLNALSLLTFRYRNQDSSEGSDVTVLDPTTYDNAGVTTTVPQGNDATIQRVYVFPSNVIRVQRGQEVFNTISQAIDRVGSEQFTTEPNIEQNGLLLASIVIRKDATDLTDESQARIFISSRFGELGSVGSSATTNLQQAFDNSLDPEILTDSTRGALTIKRGSAADTDNILEGKNGADALTFSVTGQGYAFVNDRLNLNPQLAANVTGTPSNGDLIYVSDTDATFTEVGHWSYTSGAWVKVGGGGDTIFTGGTFTGDSTVNLDGNSITFDNTSQTNGEFLVDFSGSTSGSNDLFRVNAETTGAYFKMRSSGEFWIASAGGSALRLFSSSGSAVMNVNSIPNGSSNYWYGNIIKLGRQSTDRLEVDEGLRLYNYNNDQEHRIRTANSGSAVEWFRNGLRGAFYVGGTTLIGTEKISLQGSTAIKGVGTTTGTTLALYDNDTTPNKTWEWLDNGSLFVNGTQTFTGTGSYTSFTIENGVITNAS